MKIAICEDVMADQLVLRRALDAVKENLQIEMKYEFFENGEQLLSRIESGISYDLAILDIYLTGEDGLKIAQKLRGISQIPVAFSTSSREFALDAYDVDPIHYLLKPITAEKLMELIKRLFKRMGKPVKSLTLISARSTYEFPLIHIREIVSQNKGIHIRMKRDEQSAWLAFPFRETAWLQDEPGFVLINRGHLINLDEIYSIDYDTCRMKDGRIENISRRERGIVQKKFKEYLFRQMDGN